MGFNISDANGISRFMQYLAEGEVLPYFKEKEEGVLVQITFSEFQSLNPEEKKSVYDKLEGIISKFEDTTTPELSKIIQVRNQIFYESHKPSTEIQTPEEVKGHIQSYTSPENIASSVQVSKSWQAAGNVVRTQQLNQGLALRDAIPPIINTAGEAVAWLKENIDCMTLKYADFRGFGDVNASHLEELVALSPNLTHLFINTEKITAIKALPEKLEKLDCSGCRKLKSLPELPASLKVLKCMGSVDLEKLPKLPENLTHLNCKKCWNLNSLPELPMKLQKLYCEKTPITELPALPDSLLILSCEECPIDHLPNLPKALKTLYLESCPITHLPELPEGLQELFCRLSPIVQLPELPLSLIKLDCFDCPNLESLPRLPDLLELLFCSKCSSLTELPELPLKLQGLFCENCQINELPGLPPELTELYCTDCPLAELPMLPSPLLELYCGGCRINHLPNLPERLQKLNVENCENLNSLPAFPKSLKGLKFWGCPLDEESEARAEEFNKTHRRLMW